MKQFDLAFKTATDNKYPYIRFVRAEFAKEEQLLTVIFIVDANAVDNGILSDAVKAEIVTALTQFMPDKINFAVKYVKVFADADTVRIKLVQSMTKHIPIIATALNASDIEIAVNDYVVDIKIRAVKTIFALLDDVTMREKILDDLYESFVESINFEVIEKYISEEEKAKIDEKSKQIVNNAGINCNIEVDENGRVIEGENNVFADLREVFSDSISVYEQSRQIKATAINNIVGKGYLTDKPMYICDIKDTFESAVICGTVQGLARREYRNKSFNNPAVNTKGKYKKNTTDEMLPLYSFFVDDTTGRFSAVYFPFDCKNSYLEQTLKDGAEVVISGKLSERNGSRQMTIDKMWLAEIDFSTVKKELPQKKEPKSYNTVHPEKYFEASQCDMAELMDGNKEVAPYLRGKSFVAFDLETTGLDVSSCLIVQLSGYKIVDGKIVESFSTLVNPMCHIPAESSAVHGIYDNDVLSAPEFYEVLPDFYKFTRGATLVGHNAFGYDMPILSRLARAYGYVFENPVLDTFILAKAQYSLPKYNLGALSKFFNVSLENAHRADADSLATAKCFIKLADRLK